MARSNRLNLINWSFWSMALSVTLLPIGLGGDRPVSLGMAQMGLAFSCLFLAAHHDVWAHLRFFLRLRWALGLFGLVLLWAFFQTLPIVPTNWAHPLWLEARTVLGGPSRGSISVDPEDAIKGLTRLVTYLAAGILTYVLTQDVRRGRKLLQLIWYTGVAICTYGIVIYLTGNSSILWFQKWAYLDDLTATFVNRNHFAIYAGMIFVTGVALLMQSWGREVREMKPHQRIKALKDWIAQRAIPQGFLLLLVFSSIIFSHSRAGFTLTLIGLGCFIFFYQIYLKAWRRALIIAVLAIIVIAMALCVAFEFSERFATLFSDWSSLDRLRVYRLGWHVLQDNPWLGYGLNGFEPEFRLYQQNMLMEFNHAHSDILESLIDLGIPFGLAIWSAVALLLSGLWHGITTRRQSGAFPVLGLTASIMLLGHACVDFSLQIPGDVVIWAALIGAGLAQSWSQAERR